MDATILKDIKSTSLGPATASQTPISLLIFNLQPIKQKQDIQNSNKLGTISYLPKRISGRSKRRTETGGKNIPHHTKRQFFDNNDTYLTKSIAHQ